MANSQGSGLKPHKPKIICASCKGTGTVALGDELFTAYLAVRKIGKATSGDVWKQLGLIGKVGVSAISNRLEDLWRKGVIKRHKRTKGPPAYLYEVAV